MMQETAVRIPVGNVKVEGNLTVSSDAKGIVLFAHGSGSSRFSPRNQYVAKEFNKASIGTLLFDLLTPEEEEEDIVTAEYRFNIPLLAERLIGATKWLRNNQTTENYKLGYFGASTGAAAALIAAAKLPNDISAVVSRGGRPDLAEGYLSQVVAPTLLLVGSLDTVVIELNRQAMAQMKNENKLVLISGATHLFEERGKLEEVAALSKDWFLRYLR
ncbi:MAG: dienelactone hydrolase family protein [Candidatus Bathyarchaeota archaeon]|jgi:pimeloyl-ACP methyl ester carboxylesterase|nr:dienelactone hydrolase family protein [Candidatus Bathyarchaeota archaeon]